MASDNCNVTIYNSTFGLNTGSVIYISESNLSVVNSSFFNNSTPLIGGGISSFNSTLHVYNSDFYNNKAKTGGGAFCLASSVATVKNCTIFNNSNTAWQCL